MKLWIYEILTWLIICLGKLRVSLKLSRKQAREGIMEVPYRGQSFIDECCDCGLRHFNNIVSLKKIKWRALRPYGYKYRLR